jgi:hypothetical protein
MAAARISRLTAALLGWTVVWTVEDGVVFFMRSPQYFTTEVCRRTCKMIDLPELFLEITSWD